jgi:hypothetical protein
MLRMNNIAEQIIRKMGGVAKLVEITGLDKSRIYRWTYPKDRGGTGGLIPAHHQQVILEAAIRNGIDVRPNDFFKIELQSPTSQTDTT